MSVGFVYEKSRSKARIAVSKFLLKIPGKLRLFGRFKRYHKACVFLVDGMTKFKEMKSKYSVDFKLKWQKYFKKLQEIGKEFHHPPFNILEIRPKIIPYGKVIKILDDIFFCETITYMKTSLSKKITENKNYIFNLMIIEELENLKPYSEIYFQAVQYKDFNPLVHYLPQFKEKIQNIKKSETWNFTTGVKKTRRFSSSDSELFNRKFELEIEDNFVIALILLTHGIPSLVKLGMDNKKNLRSSPKNVVLI